MTDAAAILDDIAVMLSTISETEVTLIDGGFRIREVDGYYIDVIRMMVNWWVTETYKDTPWEYGRWWCFAGADITALIRVVQVVAEWDCTADTEPSGWVKNGQTGELRKPDGR